MHSPNIATTWAAVVAVGLVVLGVLVLGGVRLIRFVVEQVRLITAGRSGDAAARERRRDAMRRLKALAMLYAFAAVPATLSYAHLVGWARSSLELSNGLEYLVPLALDEAGMFLSWLAFADAVAGESGMLNRMLVWAFSGASAAFNWSNAPQGPAHPGAREFFAGMSVAAALMFERAFKATRRDALKSLGLSHRPLIQVRPLQWLTNFGETQRMMRVLIKEPTITSEYDALTVVRWRAAMKEAERKAFRSSRKRQGRRWFVRRVVITAQPVLQLSDGLQATAAAAAAVLQPYLLATHAGTLQGRKAPAAVLLEEALNPTMTGAVNPPGVVSLPSPRQGGMGGQNPGEGETGNPDPTQASKQATLSAEIGAVLNAVGAPSSLDDVVARVAETQQGLSEDVLKESVDAVIEARKTGGDLSEADLAMLLRKAPRTARRYLRAAEAIVQGKPELILRSAA